MTGQLNAPHDGSDDRAPQQLDLTRSRPILSIAAAFSAVNAVVQFASGNSFEGWFSLAFMTPALWLLLDTARQRGHVGLVREVLPTALLFCVPVVRGVLVGAALG